MPGISKWETGHQFTHRNAHIHDGDARLDLTCKCSYLFDNFFCQNLGVFSCSHSKIVVHFLRQVDFSQRPCLLCGSSPKIINSHDLHFNCSVFFHISIHHFFGEQNLYQKDSSGTQNVRKKWRNIEHHWAGSLAEKLSLLNALSWESSNRSSLDCKFQIFVSSFTMKKIDDALDLGAASNFYSRVSIMISLCQFFLNSSEQIGAFPWRLAAVSGTARGLGRLPPFRSCRKKHDIFMLSKNSYACL